MHYEILEQLNKKNEYVDILPFLVKKDYNRWVAFEAIKELNKKGLIRTGEGPADDSLSWAYLRNLEYGEDLADGFRYGKTPAEMLNRGDEIFLMITQEGKKELEGRKNWAQRNPVLFGILMALLGAALTIIGKKFF
jgi:hypothetical protein